MGKNGVIGLIVPLSSEFTDRIFHHHETYAMVSEDGATDVQPGDRLFFYDTAGRGLEGEALIEEVSFESARDLLARAHDLYLSADELTDYLRREGRTEYDELLVLKVEDATKYFRPLKCTLQVPRGGLCLNASISAQIMRENQ